MADSPSMSKTGYMIHILYFKTQNEIQENNPFSLNPIVISWNNQVLALCSKYSVCSYVHRQSTWNWFKLNEINLWNLTCLLTNFRKVVLGKRLGNAMALALTRKNEEWYIPLLAKYSPAVCKVKVYWLYNFSVSKLCPQTVEGIRNGDPNWQGFKKQDIKILWILKCFN